MGEGFQMVWEDNNLKINKSNNVHNVSPLVSEFDLVEAPGRLTS